MLISKEQHELEAEIPCFNELMEEKINANSALRLIDKIETHYSADVVMVSRGIPDTFLNRGVGFFVILRKRIT